MLTSAPSGHGCGVCLLEVEIICFLPPSPTSFPPSLTPSLPHIPLVPFWLLTNICPSFCSLSPLLSLLWSLALALLLSRILPLSGEPSPTTHTPISTQVPADGARAGGEGGCGRGRGKEGCSSRGKKGKRYGLGFRNRAVWLRPWRWGLWFRIT